MKKAKTIMIQGTGSGVGKSIIVSAFCRIFLQDGYCVAPFKAQNMALNSFVTEDGGEIGRAQATQAQACKIKPTVDMNPVLLKPTTDTGAQIIVCGKPIGNMQAVEYHKYKPQLIETIKQCFTRLQQQYEIIVIEGAGSPAEINLKDNDIVNMYMAKIADAPVILVVDIDKGGAFAWIAGTLELLPSDERSRIKGVIINKFRGDKTLLQSGLEFMEKRYKVPILGVIPYFHNICIAEEDSLGLEKRKRGKKKGCEIEVGVIKLPHISNFTDFDALENEPDVNLHYVNDKEELGSLDVTIIPGTKNTIEDLNYLKRSGLAQKITSNFESQPTNILVGICGGYQMLGEWIYDPTDVESKKKRIKGLGILPIITQMYPEKILSQVKAHDLFSGIEVSGYEIHHGRSEEVKKVEPMFEIHGMNKTDGAQILNRKCWGTYIHGVFDSDTFRRNFLNDVRIQKGMQPLAEGKTYNVDIEIDKLSCLIRENINLDLLYDIL
ncbi:MAG: cobyric acid synthase [Nitrospirota bacterium]